MIPIRDKLIKSMADMDDLEDYVKKTEDAQMGMMVEIVNEYGNEIYSLLRTLKELHCGEWELKNWDAIAKDEMEPWMNDFVNHQVPGGESYVQLHDRVIKCFERIAASPRPAVAVMHGGVIRSILAHLTGTALKDSFGKFKPHYGCVIKVDGNEYQFLSNIPTEKEQHKPSQF